MNRCIAALAASVTLVVAGAPALGQWNPPTGQWLKTDARDLRVMAWNVQDKICSTGTKVEGINGWCALARIVAALQPDVLVMEEVGDNSGNGSGSGVDSVANLTSTIGMWLHGGLDSFHGNSAVTAYVQKYAPGYDLPYVYVSDQQDGFNRNVVLSRYPFADLTGDTRSVISNWSMVAAAYAPGGSAGIRGYIFAEIDLPNASYGGDLVVGCGHLKSGGTAQDLADRLTASKNIAYYIDAIFNGLGTATPDPNNKILKSPNPTQILNARTPVIWGGDFNEDETNNGRDGPTLWMTRAQDANPSGTDGTDRDRSDSTYDASVEPISGNRTTQGSSKLDYLCWQDSVASPRRTFTFNSQFYSGANSGAMPSQLVGFAGGATLTSSAASDHRPVIGDFIMPVPFPGAFTLTAPDDFSLGVSLTPTLTWTAASNAVTYTVKIADNPALTSPILTAAGLGTTSYAVPAATLVKCTTYYWGVTAVNTSGSTLSTPSSFSFETYRPADFDGNGFVNGDDFDGFMEAFYYGFIEADFDQNEFVNGDDFDAFTEAFAAGC